MFLTPEAINEGYERTREHRRKKPEIVEIPRKQLEEILELTLSSGINSKAKIQEIIRNLLEGKKE